MTRAQIIAELRRSATEDLDPWSSVQFHASEVACDHTMKAEATFYLSNGDLRTFYLLVACSLEDEQ